MVAGRQRGESARLSYQRAVIAIGSAGERQIVLMWIKRWMDWTSGGARE
jgi:hypothetical protein